MCSIPARRGIHRGREHEVGREGRAAKHPADRDEAFFERLSEHFERLEIELGHFIEKQDAFVREGDLPCLGCAAAAHEAGVAHAAVRRAEWARGYQPLAGFQPRREEIRLRDHAQTLRSSDRLQ